MGEVVPIRATKVPTFPGSVDNSRYILVGHDPVLCPDLMRWGHWMQDAERHVEKTYIGDTFVSTVFLGLDHSFNDGPPVLFETMIFGGRHDDYMDRYLTWDEAEAGHARAVRMVRKFDSWLWRYRWHWAAFWIAGLLIYYFT